MHVDYADASSVRAALQGARRVLLISSSDFAHRVEQHARVIDAAHDAAVELLAYTSTPRADSSGSKLAVGHAETEKLIRASGLPFTMLRNSTYMEVLAGQTTSEALREGVITGASGTGRLSPASRVELAAAAAAVLTGEGHAGAVYELGGDLSYTMAEVAEAVGDWAGKPITYRDLPVEEFRALLIQRGMPELVAEMFADTQLAMARDESLVTTGDLHRLIGGPTRSLAEALAER